MLNLMKTRTVSRLFYVGSVAALAACGGGTPNVEEPPVQQVAGLSSSSATTTVSLSGIALDGVAGTVATFSGELNRGADTATVAGLDGSINAARTVITPSDGGRVVLTPEEDRFAARFTATPLTGNETIGVVGIPTSVADLPGGTVTYSGDTNLLVQNGTTVLTLTGDVEIAARFASDSVTTTLSGLSGTSTNGISPSVSVNDAGAITISSSALSGNTFTGGSATVSSTVFDVGSSAAVTVSGGVFGPNGEEAGGALLIDDTVIGDVRIAGDFLAER